MQEIELRWWNLMRQVTKKKLYLRLEKHIDSGGFIVLLVKVFPMDGSQKCLLSAFDLDHRTELFFKVEKFVKEYKA